MNYAQLTDWHNLLSAYQKTSKGKRGKPDVAAFELFLEPQLLLLSQQLQEQSYQPGAYHSFYIHEPKRRLISAAPFRDRVIHHALCNVIEPTFERSFISDSYANRVGKGTHKALARCQQFARQFHYCLPCDVKQFFPSVDHAILQNLLAKKIADPQIMWLVEQILASGVGVLADEYEMVYFAGDDLFAVNRPRGLPIGNLTSQFWANVYLNPLDHFIKRRLQCKGYLRYADDFLLFGNEKATLWAWHKEIIAFCADLRLTLHENRMQPRPVETGIPFLGFTVFPQQKRLKRRKGVHFQRKLRKLCQQYADGDIPLEKVTASVQGWINHTRFGNTVGLRKAILGKQIVKPPPPP